jgi:hypothetical protein
MLIEYIIFRRHEGHDVQSAAAGEGSRIKVTTLAP